MHIAPRTNAILAGARLSNAEASRAEVPVERHNAPCATRTGMGRPPPSSSVVDHRGPICYPCSRHAPPLRLDSGNDYRPYHRRNRGAGRGPGESDDGVGASRWHRFLTEFGIELPRLRSTRRHFCRLCLDWTERRPHTAGAVGAAITKRYFDLGWIERMKRSHAVIVTPLGRRGFHKTFGIDASEPADRRKR